MLRRLAILGSCLVIWCLMAAAAAGGEDEAARQAWHGSAVEELTRLAEAGDREAQARLAAMYEGGLGVPADPARARYWRRRAAVSGSETDREDDWQGR